MANLVVTAANEIRRSYFSTATVIDADESVLRPRQAYSNNTPVRVLQGNNIVITYGDWVHLLQNVTQAGGATGLSNPVTGRYSSNSLAAIDGETLELGDRVEVPATVATAFNPRIPSGIYRCVSISPPTIQIVDPPIYNLTHSNEIGGAVYYRANATIPGGLEGLAPATLTLNGTVSQGRPDIPISNFENFIDGNPNTSGNGSNSSWQNATMPITRVEDIYAFEWTIGSGRTSYDTSTQWAISDLKYRNGPDVIRLADINTTVNASTLQRHSSSTWANSASGAAKYYAYFSTPVVLTGLYAGEGSGYRTFYYDFRALVPNLNCQIRLAGGIIPEAGSILNISQDAARTFYPAIQPGAYPVINNSGTGSWKLGARFDLIAPIGTAISYSLYVDASQYTVDYGQTIDLQVGSLYQLRVNTPEAIARTVYTFQQSGTTEVMIGQSTSTRDNFSVFFTPTVGAYERARAGATAEIWASCDGAIQPKKFPLRFTYNQRGLLESPGDGLFFPIGASIPLTVVPDPVRTFASLSWSLTDANGNTGFTSVRTETTTAFAPTDAGEYTLNVTIAYDDSDLPNEYFSVRLTMLTVPEVGAETINGDGTTTLSYPGPITINFQTTPFLAGGIEHLRFIVSAPAGDPFVQSEVASLDANGGTIQTAGFSGGPDGFTTDTANVGIDGAASVRLTYTTRSGRSLTHTFPVVRP